MLGRTKDHDAVTERTDAVVAADARQIMALDTKALPI